MEVLQIDSLILKKCIVQYIYKVYHQSMLNEPTVFSTAAIATSPAAYPKCI